MFVYPAPSYRDGPGMRFRTVNLAANCSEEIKMTAEIKTMLEKIEILSEKHLREEMGLSREMGGRSA